jgi:uncharacterized membrane protein
VKTERLQTLADGVFAIALTLLVLSLPVPKGAANLGHLLVRQWPYYAAYVISFVTIAIAWLNHHALMDGVARVDRTLMELTLLLLLFVALVPWPTDLLATYLRDGSQSSAAAVTYGIVLTLLASSFTMIWIWLARKDELAHPHARGHLSASIRRSLVGPAVYLTGTLIAILSAPIAFALFAAVPLYFVLSRRSAQVSPR